MNSREFVEDYCDACKYIKFSTSSREYLEERIEQHVAEAVAEHRTVVLGEGDTVVSDIHNRDKKWAGICFTKQSSSIGEYTDISSDTDEGAFLRIVTENQDSIDVLIEALKRAKAYM